MPSVFDLVIAVLVAAALIAALNLLFRRARPNGMAVGCLAAFLVFAALAVIVTV